MTKHHILVADPNPVVRKLLLVVFDAERYQLSFASDGEEALGSAIVDPPHLLVSEIRLDRLDGVHLVEQLKQHPRTRHVKVLALTTCTSEWDIRRARRAGVEVYMTKPFSPAQLLLSVDGLLAGEPAARLERQGALDQQNIP